MTDQPPPSPPSRIRPIWFVGGAAVLVALAACAVVTIVIAAVMISFTNNISSSATPTPQAAAQNPTLPPVNSSVPTPLPPVNPTVSATSIPTVAAQLPPPDQAVRTYYQLVSQQQYDQSWPLLTEAFRQKFNCCAPNFNYSGYLDWWNSVNYVDFGTVSVVSETGAQAVVYAQLYYVMNMGARSSVDADPYIELLYNPATNGWQFNDKRASP